MAGMKASVAAKCFVSIFLSIGVLTGSAAADSDPASKPSDGAEQLATPKGLPPLAGVAVALLKNPPEPEGYAWSIRLSVPKVEWEIVGKERPKFEWTKVEAHVELITMDIAMGYAEATQLSEKAQDRIVDLSGRRLGREEAQKRLASNTPVLVSVSGEMPDSFYLQCVKPETLVVLFGLPSSREYKLLPRARAGRAQTE